MEVLHGGSSRIPFILQLFFKIFLEVMIRQAILKDKHGVQHMFCFEEFKHSSSCISKCNSFISHLLRWCYVIVDNFPSCFMIHKFSRVTYLKYIIFSSFRTSFQSINLFIGVILGYISPKAFPKDCCYLWCL